MVPRASSIFLLSIESACKGMSGRLHASPAGDRSSVLVSPSTIKTVSVMESASGGRLVNHSAFAQDFKTRSACGLEADFSTTS